jgi:dipeptidyl aminopeptidase/acylaminoacyl peptidase
MTTRRLTLDDLDRLAVPYDPAISPDGRTVVYGLRRPDTAADRDDRSLWVVSAAGGDARELTRGPADSAPRWSPDGTRLAFLRKAGDAGQLHLLDMTHPGEPEQVTELPFGAGAAVWSPDGTRIAFIAPRDVAAEAAGDMADPAAKPDPHAPVVVDRLGYKADGAGLLRSLRPHIHVLQLADRDCRAVTGGDFSVGSVAWHSDGDRLAFSADDLPDADITGASAVFVFDPADPAAGHRRVGPAGGQMGPVAWPLADRGPLAVGRLDTEVGHGDLLLFAAAAEDAEVTDLSGALDRNVMPGAPGYPGGAPQLESDGAHLVFCARDAGCTHLFRVPVDGSAPPERLLGGPDEVVSGLSVAGAARVAACVVAGPHSYGEVVLLDTATGERTVLTDHTVGSLPDVALFPAEPRSFTVGDGSTVHGWLLRDPDLTEPGPLLLDAHGGPHNAWSPVPDLGHGYQQHLVAQGWSVLMLNVRASDGYGAEHFTRNVGSWGHGDQADFLDPVDALVAEGIADPDRLAVTGYSYGGYTTCWLTGHTDRFAAAVGGGVVADTVSELASDAGHPVLGSTLKANPWESAEQLRAQSPMESVGRVRTPTLLLHGGDDERCPRGQAEEWFVALRAQNVPTRLVLYPGASHLFILEGRPSHRRDYCARLIDWVTTYCAGEASS